MKKLLLTVLLLYGCSKEDFKTPQLTIGKMYNLKANVFKPTGFQPVCPCRLDSLYIGFGGVYYANIYGHPNRDDKATYERNGVKYDSVTTTNMFLEWPIPRDNLK